MNRLTFDLEDDEFEVLRDFNYHSGLVGGVKGYVKELVQNHVRLHIEGYLLYVRRRHHWYKSNLDDYVESKEFCEKYGFDFNKYQKEIDEKRKK